MDEDNKSLINVKEVINSLVELTVILIIASAMIFMVGIVASLI